MKNISKEQIKDTGMVAVLIFLLLGIFTKMNIYFEIALVLLIIDLLIPKLFTPVAIIWFGLSKILGTVTSKIILTIIFFLVVFPIGSIRKMLGKDSLQLKKFKRGSGSVFIERNYTYTHQDLEQPY